MGYSSHRHEVAIMHTSSKENPSLVMLDDYSSSQDLDWVSVQSNLHSTTNAYRYDAYHGCPIMAKYIRNSKPKYRNLVTIEAGE